MVLLTMTLSIVEALHTREQLISTEKSPVEGEPSLKEPAVGKPIAHNQILELWTSLKDHDVSKYSLEFMLKGARVYIPPPPPKPEPGRLSTPALLCFPWANMLIMTDSGIQGSHGPASTR